MYFEVIGRLRGRYGVTKPDAESLFKHCDDDGNGVIDMEELILTVT